MNANISDESTLMSEVGPQNLREAIAKDSFLPEPKTSGSIVIHGDTGNRVAGIKALTSE